VACTHGVDGMAARGWLASTGLDPQNMTPGDLADLIYYRLVQNMQADDKSAFDMKLTTQAPSKKANMEGVAALRAYMAAR